MPPGPPPPPTTPPSLEPLPAFLPPKKPKRDQSKDWHRLLGRANAVSSIGLLFLVLLALGGGGGYFYSQSRKAAPAAPKTSVTSLSADDIAKLGQIGSNLGGAGQTLNIGADALFRGKVDVGSDLNVGGHFNANGPVTLSQLNITGTTAATGLNVGSNLNVTGNTTLQQGLSVGQLATFAGGINVGGNASVNALNASTIAVRTISITGPLTISHLSTQGPAPALATGTAVGAGGTASISGNDTAGTLNFNTGTTPPAGILGSITFRAPYSGTVHVLLSPLTGAASTSPVYVTRSAAGFQVRTDTPLPAGAVISFDYFVTQ